MDSETSENTGTTVDRIRQRIVGLVEDHFNTGEKIVYLSRLGNELGPDRLTLESLTGAKLGHYLRDHLPYPIGAAGQHRNVLYLAPPGTDINSLAVPPGSQRSSPDPSSPSTTIPKYVHRFWAAFAKPLPFGETQRFINLSTLFFGPDADALRVEDADDIRPIEPGYIAPAESRGVETAERIARWLHSQALDGRSFLAETKRSADQRGSLLAAVIDTLTPEQLKRTALPLDVVKALFERRT